eukprot:c27734_g1_i1 orf=510-1811(+)
MTVTWTSGYGIDDAMPIVQWGPEWKDDQFISPAGTLTYGRDDMCGPPAKTVGWRSPGFTHTAFLKELWPNTKYSYKIGHRMQNGSFIWGRKRQFIASPYPGQDSLQQIVVVGDTGKAEKDGSNEYANYQPGSLNTTDRIVEDLDNIDIVFHVGDLSYSNGYISQWDQFNEMFQQITERVPVMVASGNHERDYPGTGSFYENPDSGGECGISAQNNYFFPGKDSSKWWYSTDYGMFHFCVINTELDWREGSKQHEFIENCLSSVDRQKQPWLIFIGHRVLGYSSNLWYGTEGSFDEPMGREALQNLWQKYRVDVAFWGHVHNYERSYPTLENVVVSDEKNHYSGTFNATIHVVIGGGGAHLNEDSSLSTAWSVYRDVDFGFAKLSAFNHSSLLFEYKKSRDGEIYDEFWITRNPVDVMGCDSINYFCPEKTLAS